MTQAEARMIRELIHLANRPGSSHFAVGGEEKRTATNLVAQGIAEAVSTDSEGAPLDIQLANR